jgi:hypothetical protein
MWDPVSPTAVGHAIFSCLVFPTVKGQNVETSIVCSGTASATSAGVARTGMVAFKDISVFTVILLSLLDYNVDNNRLNALPRARGLLLRPRVFCHALLGLSDIATHGMEFAIAPL